MNENPRLDPTTLSESAKAKLYTRAQNDAKLHRILLKWDACYADWCAERDAELLADLEATPEEAADFAPSGGFIARNYPEDVTPYGYYEEDI